ncbi:MAG TPA: serine/threonine-protein kinase [Enhygromyxa sp.]|nr:serine/threonine-protein kinase [Enhygromyxa sp.]
MAGDDRGKSDASLQAKLSLLSLEDGTVSATVEGDDGDDRVPSRPRDAMPERIGRYLVLAKLGQGAMGVVYSAYDPDLDRKLALKLLHDEEQRGDRTIRLLREAQALARVSHPNVIQVYDVGTFEERVYIAMEYVDGVSLASWRAADRRTPAQILAVFAKAGRGLAAAHEKGLVHRDFKPDNVLVARDGRVVVLDFGIAHAVGTAEPLEQDDDAIRRRIVEHSMTHGPVPTLGGSLTGTSRALDTEVTRAGALIGTPAYMAPEQLEGRSTDERTDQFSFCIALWEALHDERPFPGESPLALWQAMRDGAIRQPTTAGIRSTVQRALIRGLELAPERRFPNMAALLAALEHDPAVVRRRLAIGLAAVAALGLTIWSVATRPGPESVCAAAEQRFDSSWNRERRSAIEQAFTDSGSPLADQSLPTVLDGLDRYADQWQAMYVDACQATHVRGEQSEELLDRRMACLEERRLGFDALVDVLLEPDAIVVENAATAVAKLRPIDTCANHRALTARVAPPEDPALAERVEAIGRELSLARARRDAGDHQRAMTIAREAESRAATTVYAPIQAAALIEVGLTLNETGDYAGAEGKLREGFYQALASGDEQACVEASTALVQVTGDHQRNFDGGSNWARIADALLDRRSDQRSRARVELEIFLGILHWRQGELERARVELEAALTLAQALAEPQLEARVRNALGSTLWGLGKPDEAAAQFEIHLDTLARELGDQHPKLGPALNNLASAHYSLGRLDLAEAELTRALRIYETSYGDEHPSVANSLNNLAVITTKLGKLEQARDLQLRVIGIYERTVGPEHPELANVWSNLGRTLRMLEDFEDAAEYYRRAYERRVAALGTEHTDTMTSLGGLALTQLDLGQREQGFANYEIVLATQRRLLGDDHPDVAEVELQVGGAMVEHGRAREGEAMLRKALATRERVLAPDHPDIAESLAALAHALVERGANDEAVQLLDRFKAMEAAAKPSLTTRARVRLDRARALLASKDRTAARQAAREGLELLDGAEGPANKRLRRALSEWLASHP